jgi:hypothetical protein
MPRRGPRSIGGRNGIAELDTGDALQRDSAPVQFAFAPDMPDADPAIAIPIGFAGIDAEQGPRWISPKQVSGDCGEGVLIHAADAAVDLCAELASQGGGEAAVGAVEPFIRYELGDVAVAGAGGCPCGRTLPVIARVEGRSRNAFVFRDGSRMWPRTSMVRAMHPFVAFARFQMIQLDYERIEFRYLPDGSGRAPDVAGLNAHARGVFHASVELDPVEVDALIPGPSGKFEEFISKVPTAPAAGPVEQ